MSQTAAIIDLRSDGVSAALVELGSAKKGAGPDDTVGSRVIKLSQREIDFQQQLNLERFFSQIVTALKEVLAEIFARPATGGRPGEIICFLAAPFYASQTRTIRQTGAAETAVSQQLIADLVTADRQRFQTQNQPLYREILRDAHELIEHKIMQIKLNRYETSSPFGQKAREIEINHYVSVGSKRLLDRLRELVAVYRPGGKIVFHSFPFTFYAALNDFSNVLLLDLGGEMTEVSLVAHNILWETVSFPLGRNFLIRRLASDFQTVPEEVFSALKIYQRGGQNKLTSERFRQILNQAKSEWLDRFKEALRALMESHLGATKLWAVGDPLTTPIFLDWIKEGSYQDLLISDKGLAPFLVTGQRLNLANHPHLLLELAFCDKLVGKS